MTGAPVVEALQQFPDRRVQLGQRGKSSVPQPRMDPPLRDLDGHLDLSLVARLARAGRDDGRVAMCRHVRVAAIDLWIVEAGLGDPGFEIV